MAHLEEVGEKQVAEEKSVEKAEEKSAEKAEEKAEELTYQQRVIRLELESARCEMEAASVQEEAERGEPDEHVVVEGMEKPLE